MARNGSGSYSLPTGNPVVSGTTITSTWANATLADLANETTDSLSRSGKGGMAAALQLADGTVAAPGLTFGLDTDSGIYRIGANNVGVALAGAKVLDIGATATALTGGLTVSATLGVTGDSTLSGAAHIVGAITADSTISSKKLTATGAAGVEGAALSNGTAATGATPQNALVLNNGHMAMAGVVDPNSNIPLNKVLVPGLIPRAWARIDTDGAGGATLIAGMNISSVAIVAGDLQVTLAQAVGSAAGADICVLAMLAQIGNEFLYATPTSTQLIHINAVSYVDATGAVSLGVAARKVSMVVFGRQ